MKHTAKLNPQRAYHARASSLDYSMRIQDEAEILALRQGDEAEAKRRRDARQDLKKRQHLDRPSLRYDPLQEYLSSQRLYADFDGEAYVPDERRLWRAVETLREAMEADRLGKPFGRQNFAESEEEVLPAIKNPPAPADPINLWRKARRTVNADGSPAQCPATFKPKNPKRAPGRPVQWVEIQALRRVFGGQQGHSARGLWEYAMAGFPKPEWKEAFIGVVVFRTSWRNAVEHVGAGSKIKGSTLSANSRGDKLMRQAVVGVLERAAQHLESWG